MIRTRNRSCRAPRAARSGSACRVQGTRVCCGRGSIEPYLRFFFFFFFSFLVQWWQQPRLICDPDPPYPGWLARWLRASTQAKLRLRVRCFVRSSSSSSSTSRSGSFVSIGKFIYPSLTSRPPIRLSSSLSLDGLLYFTPLLQSFFFFSF